MQNNQGDGVRRLQQTLAADTAGSGSPFRAQQELERLASMQLHASRNFFRLLQIDRELRARDMPKPTGAILADALETDRKRLGRELHTGVGQAIAGIYVHISLLENALQHAPEPVRQSLDRIRSLAQSALEQVRNVSRSLYVPAWQAQSLVDALRGLWEASGISAKFDGTLDLRTLSAEPSPQVRRAIYLAAQEGISNAIQHADARRVRMSLGEEGGRIILQVADDGFGSQPPADPAPTATGGIGLRSIRDLVAELGGEFQAESTPQGAYLKISFPVIHE